MNNDAKDVIGRLRAINVMLLLLHIDRFEFPLDNKLSSLLGECRSRLLAMAKVVAELAHFGDSTRELRSCTDDILDPTNSNYYSRDYTDMLFSLYKGDNEIHHLVYENIGSIRAVLTETCCLCVSELFQSIVWLRIGFGSCYPDMPLLPLHKGWYDFCGLVTTNCGMMLEVSLADLIDMSLRSWRFSETVTVALSKDDLSDMPHKDAFLKSVAEVDYILQHSSN